MTTFRQMKLRRGISSKPSLWFFHISAASKGSVKLYTYHHVFSHLGKGVYKKGQDGLLVLGSPHKN